MIYFIDITIVKMAFLNVIETEENQSVTQIVLIAHKHNLK